MYSEPMDDALGKLFANLGAVVKLLVGGLGALAEGIGPVLIALATYLEELRVRCPEAFDEAGALRPDWQEIVEAKFGGEPAITPHSLHTDLATRRIVLNLN